MAQRNLEEPGPHTINDERRWQDWITRLYDRVNSHDQIDGSQITNQTITADEIQDLAVTSNKIGDAAVTSDKINDLAITTGKIEDLSVQADKIEDFSVNTEKINQNAVTGQIVGVDESQDSVSSSYMDLTPEIQVNQNLPSQVSSAPNLLIVNWILALTEYTPRYPDESGANLTYIYVEIVRTSDNTSVLGPYRVADIFASIIATIEYSDSQAVIGGLGASSLTAIDPNPPDSASYKAVMKYNGDSQPLAVFSRSIRAISLKR